MNKGIKAIFQVVDRATGPIRNIARSLGGLGPVTDRLQRSFRQFGIAIKNLGTMAVRVGTVIAGSFAAAGAAMGAMVANTMDAAKAATLGAERTGIALKTFQGLAYAAERSGSNMDEMADAVKDFNEKIVDAISGNDDLLKGFRRMGVSLKDTRGQLRPTESILMDVADAFSRVPDGAKKSAAAMQLFGDAGVQLIPMLNKGSKGLKETMEEARRLGLVLDEEAAASFKRLDANMMRVRASVQGLGFSIAAKLMPTLEPLVAKFTDWMMANRDLIATRIDQWFQKLPGLINQVSEAATRWGAALAPIAGAVGGVVKALGPMNVAFGAAALLIGGTMIAVIAPAVKGFLLLGSVIGKLVIAPAVAFFGQLFTAIRGGMGVMAAFNAVLTANPIGAVIVAVAALAGAAYLLYRNWGTVGPWFGRLWEGVKQVFEGIATWVKGIFTGDFETAAKGIRTAFGGVADFFATIWDGSRAIWETFGAWVKDTFGIDISGAIEGIQSAAESVVSWIETNVAGRLQAAFQAAYDFVQPIIQKITDAIEGVKAGLNWAKSLNPGNWFGGDDEAPAPRAEPTSDTSRPPLPAVRAAGRAGAAAAAMMAGGSGRERMALADALPASSAPGSPIQPAFGKGSVAGAANGGYSNGRQDVNMGGKIDIAVSQTGGPAKVKAKFEDPRIQPNVLAGPYGVTSLS